MINQSNNNLEDRFKYVSKLYDRNLLANTDFMSIIKILFYLPLGCCLLAVRLILIILIKLFMSLFSSLKTNAQFIQFCCYIYGIQPISKNKFDTNSDRIANKIFISNHVTCLDFIAIKSIIIKLNYINKDTTSDSLLQVLVNLFDLNTENKRNDDDLLKQNSNYPILYLPENFCTNGRYGLLKFSDSTPFDFISSESNHQISIIPVCLKVTRPYIPLSVNHFSVSNEFLNLLIILFVPITNFEIEFLNQTEKLSEETGDILNERVRYLIARNLNLELTDLDGNDVRNIFLEYDKYIENLVRQQQPQIHRPNINNSMNTNNNRENNRNISFDDISRLALHVRDILPNVSFDTIQRHVQKSSTLDVESVIASILDSNDYEEVEEEANDTQQSSLLPSTSSSSNMISNNNAQSNIMNNSSSSVSMKRNNSSSSSISPKKTNGYKSFQERKFELLNEARQRYLAKHAK